MNQLVSSHSSQVGRRAGRQEAKERGRRNQGARERKQEKAGGEGVARRCENDPGNEGTGERTGTTLGTKAPGNARERLWERHRPKGTCAVERRMATVMETGVRPRTERVALPYL